MFKALLILALLAITGFATTVEIQELHELWDSWKMIHNRNYEKHEETARFAIFIENYNKIIKFNAENQSVKLGLNLFSDLTPGEFKAQYTGSGYVERDQEVIRKNTLPRYNEETILGDVDWRNNGVVTGVKNQGQCGSCWCFSTTGVLESFYAINHGVLYSFSEQQIVDCASNAGNGCNGGWPYLAIQYAAQYGLTGEGNYPYTAQDGTCQYNANAVIVPNSGYAYVPNNDPNQLKGALNSHPVSVLIEADQGVFQSYSSGVISPAQGCGASLDHAVLAVGYGNIGGQDAFIVKNSWGDGWGQGGYVYISTDGSANGGEGVCGILNQPVVPQ